MASKGDLSDEPPVESVHYLLLSGLPDGTTADAVKAYLSNVFDEVNNVVLLSVGTARAEVTDDDESIQDFLKERHRIKRQIIKIELTSPPESVRKSKYQGPSFSADVGAYYPDLIEVTCDEEIGTDVLKTYFESKRSGKKKRKGVEYVEALKECVFRVKFKSPQDAAAVIAKKKHYQNTVNIEVCYVPISPVKEYDKSKLLIKNIPKDTGADYVSLFIENCLHLRENTFRLDLRSNCGVLVLKSVYTDEELNEMVQKLSARKMRQQQLTIERCQINHSIIITGITNNTFATKDGLEAYFEGPRSGGGEDVIEKVEMLTKSKAKVTFNDHSVIQRVLQREHTRLGQSVSLTECSVLDSFEVMSSSDSEYESAEEEDRLRDMPIHRKTNNKKTEEKPSKKVNKKKQKASKKKKKDSSSDDDDNTDILSPTKERGGKEETPPTATIIPKPILYPLDPLLVKYIHLKPEITKSIEEEFQVTIKVEIKAKDEGIFTIHPSASSPRDWSVKAVEMIRSSLVRVDIPVPPEVTSAVYPLVMKTCNDEGLQFALGQGQNKVAIAGHRGTVTKLQDDISEICNRMIQTVGEVELSQEDYVYLKVYMLPHVQQRHSAVKLQCHNDRYCLTIEGSIKDVNDVKTKLSQYLFHNKVPVNLQPVALRFLHDQPGKQKLQSIFRSSTEVVPYFSFDINNQLVLLLLCSNNCIAKAENVAKIIQQEIVVQTNDLPRSFKTRVSDSQFAYFQANLATKHLFSAIVDQNNLILVSTSGSMSAVVDEFQTFISQECSTTDTINFKKGVWRLIHSTSMEKKWTNLKEDIEKKGVEVVPSLNSTAQIMIKGEVYNVEGAKERILEFQSAVKMREVTFSRPGICQYFLSNHQGQTILRGIESQANVCIEVEINKEGSGDSEHSITGGPILKSAGFGFTAEMKRVNLIVGDITEFNRADVIVNAANTQLQHAAGIAGAIAQKGGPTIQEDSYNYIRKRGQLSDGDAVLSTKTGNLPYKAIVHAVGPKWNSTGDNGREIALLKKAVRQSLEKSKDYASIAIPAISSGVFGFPVAVCANTILKAITEFSYNDPEGKLNQINIVIFECNIKDFLVACKALQNFQCSNKFQKPPAVSSAMYESKTSSTNSTFRGSSMSTSTQKLSQTTATSLPPIKISNGSITAFQEEALVNTTDQNLGFGGFVAKELLKAAGPGLQQECADSPKPVAVGSVTTTGGHNLKSKHVLHVVLPPYSGNAEKVLRQVVNKCLEECTRLKAKSLSMPSIGAGNLNYPNDVVAKVLIEETVSFFKKNQGKTSLQLVHLVIFDQKIYSEFQKVHKKLISSTMTDSVPSSFTQSHRPIRSTPCASSAFLQQQTQHYLAQESAPYTDDSSVFSLPDGLRLELLQGDISSNDSDVIVNTTQEDLKLVGSGVSAALLKKGGQALQDACDEALAKGQKATEGKIVATRATGSLKCKEVFHIAFHKGKNLTKSIQSCLELAEDKKFRSIAFPAIGTGFFNYPAASVAKAIADALKKFISSKPAHIKVIQIVVYHPHVHKEFVTAFNSIGESSGGLLSYLYTGVKAVKSFFTTSDDDDEMKMQPSLAAATFHTQYTRTRGSIKMDEEFEDLSQDTTSMPAKITLYSEVILHIYGETDAMVGRAEKKLQSIIDTTFHSDVTDDARITAFSDDAVRELEALAKKQNVDIEIDQDPALHSVKLGGFLQDVMIVKDKLRDAMSSVTHESSKKAVAEAVHKNIRWIRFNSQEKEEEYGVELNYEIEEAYSSKEKSFKAVKDQFIINFDKMEEEDMVTQSIAIVKRLDLTKVQEEQPSNWDPIPVDSQGKEKHFHFVTLSKSSPEYQKIEDAFNVTMNGSYKQIVSIQRLQNPVLYKQYAVRKREMDKHNPIGHQNERWLWHGTSPDTLAKINTRGFDRSFAGKNATVYGKGVYFARDASYSHNYTSPDANGQRHMYYTQVLTGEYTVGNGKMLVPPAKNPQLDQYVLFDSTVDDSGNPTIFVVYQDAQNYPAYMVNYQ